MTKDNKDDARLHVKEALSVYAAFFAAISHGDEETAKTHLRLLKGVDAKAASTLSSVNFEFYQTRRNELIKLFQKRLEEELREEVDMALIIRAQQLLKEY